MSKTDERKQVDSYKPVGTGNVPAGPIGGFGGRGGGARWLVSGAKPKQFRQSLKRLWQHFGKERKLLSLILFLVLLDTGIVLAGPFLIGRGIDSLSALHGLVDFSLLKIVILTLLAAYVMDAMLTLVQGWLMAGVSQRIVQGLRRTLFAKLQKLPISFFDTRTHGDLMSRLSNDIDNISTTISQSTTQLMSAALMIVGSLTMMLILSPLLTLASLVTIPLVFILTRTIASRTRILFKEQQAVLGKLNGHIEETISGIHVVKAFNHEEQVIQEFAEVNGQLCKVGIKAQIWSGYIMPLMNVINNVGFAAVAGVGGILAVNHLITVGIIASFLSYSRQFGRPLNDIANTFNTLQTALAGAERVFEVLDEPEEAADLPGAVKLQNSQGHVVFDGVCFGYRPDVPILREVSFEAQAGSSTALVGPTGAGKTTVVNLLARFYDITAGRILIDGRDIREYTRDSLRQSFGIVLQDTYLFGGTIRDNIRYGRLDATEEEIQKAAVMANADIFIRRLPHGYDTVLTESGENLSQGQRQLLAIARAILANPAILILDEATSNVDTRTELRIQEAMLKLMEGRTSFLIAHRLSTIRDADTIMVVDGGKIVEQGNHRQLIEKKGVYHYMYFSQFENVEGE
ncbi:MAG TPA: multidrug ABC transporter ATP-binding protein [Firmicutes bacterium]|jgi:ATP-binding cassette, subfamily B, multidrug efflux pump|nr:multidrug ABC transporter ATP-binding protein [Bacillota bacterium]